MSEPLFLFIGMDGTECCSNLKSRRKVDYIIETFQNNPKLSEKLNEKNRIDRLKHLSNLYKKKDELGWYTGVSSSDYGEYRGEDLLEDDIVYLPHGFIEKLTGKKLSYESEPINYTAE